MSDTILWEVEAELDIPADHNHEHRDPYGVIMTRVFYSDTAEKAAEWATETFLTQWPNDVRIKHWRLAVLNPLDLNRGTGSSVSIIYDTRIPEYPLATCVRHFDARTHPDMDQPT
jgi:hypothetical protein